MSDDTPIQPRHLTLIELLFNYAFFGGVGYWAFGSPGLVGGAVLVTLLLVRTIWIASRPVEDSHGSPRRDGLS